MIVYKAKNIKNNKVYIGQTSVSFNERKWKHKTESNKGSGHYFQRAIRKWGSDNFEWSILCECQSIEDLNKAEEIFILYYDSINRSKGYNLRYGGNNSKHSESTKRKMSKSALKINKRHTLGMKYSNDIKSKISNSRKGFKMSEEQKKKLSAINWKKKDNEYLEILNVSSIDDAKELILSFDIISEFINKFNITRSVSNSIIKHYFGDSSLNRVKENI